MKGQGVGKTLQEGLNITFNLPYRRWLACKTNFEHAFKHSHIKPPKVVFLDQKLHNAASEQNLDHPLQLLLDALEGTPICNSIRQREACGGAEPLLLTELPSLVPHSV